MVQNVSKKVRKTKYLPFYHQDLDQTEITTYESLSGFPPQSSEILVIRSIYGAG
jgi:hypothetical protein